MKVSIIGAGNSGMAMAAHLSRDGHEITLWNRSKATIAKMMETRTVRCFGEVNGEFPIDVVTDDIQLALKDPDIIMITTPANSHKELAELIGRNIRKSTVILLSPGRTFGAVEFRNVYRKFNSEYPQTIAEAQTIIHTCRKTDVDAVNIIAFKDDVLVAALDQEPGDNIIESFPQGIQEYFRLAKSMIETSIGNVGMVLHCAPLLLNAGWTENEGNEYQYYYDGITPTVGAFIEKIDAERIAVSRELGDEVESTREWMIRTYHVTGDTLYECIQNNEAYRTIGAPKSLRHRYLLEDVPCGLVPLEGVGLKLGLDMTHTTLVVDLASRMLDIDFRALGRNMEYLDISNRNIEEHSLFNGKK